jgi:HEAT repeat protein
MRHVCIRAAGLLLTVLAFAQSPDQRQTIREIRDLAKQDSSSIPKLEPYLSDPLLDVRIEAVKAIVQIDGPRSIAPLVTATRDNDPEVQIRATDGLVNAYSPGYLRTGLSGSLRRVGTAIRGKFSETNDLVIPPYVEVRPEVIEALGKLASGGGSMEARANAARALGILRGGAALEELFAALRTKDDLVLYESLIAIQKIRDRSAGPRILFLLRDLNDRVQVAAIETVGILTTKEAAPELRYALENARNARVRRAALASLAMLADETSADLFLRYLEDKDEELRAAAAEGLGRLRARQHLPVVENAFRTEKKMKPRLSLAFASVLLGRNDLGDESPLRYLVSTLNSTAYRGIAQPFLSELARDPGVRRTLYGALTGASRDEKIGLSHVFAQSGDRESLPYLEALASDSDTAVAAEGVRSLKTLRSRL